MPCSVKSLFDIECDEKSVIVLIEIVDCLLCQMYDIFCCVSVGPERCLMVFDNIVLYR